MIFSLAEGPRKIFKKNMDVFEINEINEDSDFYNAIMKERLLVAYYMPSTKSMMAAEE